MNNNRQENKLYILSAICALCTSIILIIVFSIIQGNLVGCNDGDSSGTVNYLYSIIYQAIIIMLITILLNIKEMRLRKLKNRAIEEPKTFYLKRFFISLRIALFTFFITFIFGYIIIWFVYFYYGGRM